MSRLDIDHRVIALGDPTGEEAPCMWFALCKNPANGLLRGPIGDGEFGDIPICQRCDDKIESMSSAR